MGGALGSRFRTVWCAASISFLGDGLALVAFPLLAVELTSSPVLVAGIQVARGLPILVLGLIAGVFADRVDRRKLMVRVDLGRALAVALLAVFVALDAAPLALVFVVVFVLAAGETLFDPAASALIPNVVHANDLERANGRLVASDSTAQELLGPALGAVLFSLAAWSPFALDAVSFAIAAMLVWTLPGSYRASGAECSEGSGSIRRDLAAGWDFLRTNSVLRALALMGSAQNFAAAAVEATLVLFALHALHTGNFGYGLLIVLAAVGGVFGALTTGRVVARFREGTVLVASYVIAGVATVVAALTSSLFICGVALAALFATQAWSQVINFSLRQELTPDRLRGRVQSLFRTALWVTWPAGALVGGVLAAWSFRAPMLMFALVMLSIAAIAAPLVGNRAIAKARAAVPEAGLESDLGGTAAHAEIVS